LELAQVWQGQLAGREDADEIKFDQVAEFGLRELIDGAVRRVPAGVIDQAVEARVAGERCVDQVLEVCRFLTSQ
jgi:hypothetical protein